MKSRMGVRLIERDCLTFQSLLYHNERRKSMTLYEIDAALETTFDAETGEILDSELMDKLEMERKDKITNIIHWIKNLESDAEQLKAEKQAFEKRQKSCENKANQLRAYLEKYLNGEKFESDDKTAKITYKKSQSLVIDNVWKIPEEFLEYEDPKPMKNEIKAYLKSGKTLEGVHIEEKQNMQVR